MREVRQSRPGFLRGRGSLAAFLCGVQLAFMPPGSAATSVVQSVDVDFDGIRDFDLVERELTFTSSLGG